MLVEDEGMEGFREISPMETDNAVRLIGKDWMLITAFDAQQNKVNAMTASWGAMGVLWNKSVAICFVRPQRYTYGLVESSERFSLCFFEDAYRDALKLCGTKSGRDCDKLAMAGLTEEMSDGVWGIREAKLVLVCRKLYADDLKEDAFLDRALLSNYAAKDYHRMYVCEIEKAYVRE